MTFAVAIDGPAGAGKSTIAKRVAKKLNAIYVDTGAMYRAMALFLIRNSVDGSDEEAVSNMIEQAEVSIRFENGEQQVMLNGENVNGFIRTEEVGTMASACSVYPKVRMKVLALQRDLARQNHVVMDGRDIGTHVLPDANPKIFLTASAKVRAKRRYDELVAKGETPDLFQIEKDIIERDQRDMNREIAPLKQAEDAILVDSSALTIEEVEEKIVAFVRETM